MAKKSDKPPIKIMFRAENYSWRMRIIPFEIVSESVLMVTFKSPYGDRREYKTSADHAWFDSWVKAHDYIIAKAAEKVDHAKHELDKARSIFGNVKVMKEETNVTER